MSHMSYVSFINVLWITENQLKLLEITCFLLLKKLIFLSIYLEKIVKQYAKEPILNCKE